MEFMCLYDHDVFEVIESIIVKNHNGEEYFAQQRDKYWQFGCAKISKRLIADSLRLLQTEYLDTNRTINKVTIGAADFDMDTLKKLVDADNNKA
jgi:ribosomal protein L18E